MRTDITATPEELATMRDKLGRLFDSKKFRAAWDSLGRWVNAKAGRKPGKKTKTRQLPLAMTSDPVATAPASEVAAPAAAEITPPPTPAASSNAESGAAGSPPSPAPDFSDIDRAAGPAAPAAAAAGASSGAGEGEDGPGDNSTAETIIGIVQTALVLIGDDEGVLSAQEKRMLRPPLERVLKKYDVGAAMLPAEVDLALAMATIIIVRLKKPKTATWFAKMKMWFGGRVAEVKGAALAKRVEAANS